MNRAPVDARPLRLAVVAAALALGACGSSSGPASSNGSGGTSNASGGSSSASAAVEVSTTDAFAFSPAHVSVPVGTAVRWINPGPVPHTVTSGASSRPEDSPGVVFDAPLGSGASFEYTFTTPGDQSYFCRYHEGMGMLGVVTVTP